MSSNEKTRTLVAAAEEADISRKMLVWANTFPDKPTNIDFEYLAPDGEGMALSTIQGAYITKRYVCGGYRAEYDFKLIYRIKGTSNDKRLTADAVLNSFGDWARKNLPSLDAIVLKVEPTARAALFAIYENGDEDHQILMKLTYENV